MATVYPDSIVNQFVVDDGHVANPISSFQVRGVYPPYFVSSVCGETTCGTGHVSFGAPGTRALSLSAGFTVGDGHYVGGTGVQFGAVTPVNVIVQTRPVNGVASAASFGTVTPRASFTVALGAVASAQSFGTLRFRVSALTGGVPTAQQFGVPTPKATVTRAVGAVGSAQSFGTVSAKTIFTRAVTGLGSAQAFGTPTTKATFTLAPTGLGSAQAFGLLVFRTTVTRTVVGLGSAQAFGAPRLVVPVRPGGVGTAQAFGTPQAKIGFLVPGLDSAQSFGVATIPQRVRVPGVQGSAAYTTSIVDQFVVDDGHVVSAESDLSYFGKPWVGHLFLLEFDCLDSPVPAICGVLCGVTVCGGESFTELSFCLGAGAIVNTFICGQQRIGLGESFLDPGYTTSIVDEFVVDDGHVVDGQLDSCIDSPLPAICDPATICGTVVCGGSSFDHELACLLSPEATIVNTFLCGQRPVGGVAYTAPITVTRTIDLVPVGCV